MPRLLRHRIDEIRWNRIWKRVLLFAIRLLALGKIERDGEV